MALVESPSLIETIILYLVLKHLVFAVLQTLKPSTGLLIMLICGFQSLDLQSLDRSCDDQRLVSELTFPRKGLKMRK